MPAISHPGAPQTRALAAIRKFCSELADEVNGLPVKKKVYGVVACLGVVMTLLVVISVQSIQLQAEYRRTLAASATAAINVGHVNALIYAIVMESRGIYMSTDTATVKKYADQLRKRNEELAAVVGKWEASADFADEAQFPAFKRRIEQFIEFRNELVRRAINVSPAAGREWGDNDANRALRTALNEDLEAFGRILDGRTMVASALADENRMAAWYLGLLGLAGVLLTMLTVALVNRSVIQPLTEITAATDAIGTGKLEVAIPHVRYDNESGHLARAVRNFRDAVSRNYELEQLELGTAKQRDMAMDERDRFNDKYNVTKWQLSAAINSMAEGIIMLDSKTNVLAINDQYRKIYALPPEMKAGVPLRDILQQRADSGLFTGNVEEFLGAIMSRIAARRPSTVEVTLGDGRLICVHERAMDGGGWVAIHEDITEERRRQRILERTEQLLATIIENTNEGIIAKDARNLRYVFVNRAAEVMIGMSRGEIVGKTARQLFPAQAADVIERRDRQLMEQEQQLEPIVDTVENPVRGRRTIAVRRLQIGGPDHESHLFVSMIEDRTEQAAAA
jgi:PAS domain S-box-containing protein